MFDFDPLLLARLQFAFVLAYHIIFPSLSIGLAIFLAFLKGAHLRTNKPYYDRAFNFWVKFFALSFGMGVVSGVTLSYAIGTLFGGFSEKAGAVVGPLMSYEVMTAFFLEAGFLGIMLFGKDRVSPRVHFASALLVALGTILSAFWIISANSWMHTPAGYEIVDGHIIASNWMEAIFNPSFPYRLAHMLTASWLASTFVVSAIAAWYLKRGLHTAFALNTLRASLLTAALLGSMQVVIGDQHGLNTLEHQPVKVAAMEGHWHSGGNVPLLLFAIPDQKNEKNHFEIAIPNMASLILTHSLDGEIQGLDSVAPEDRPPVFIVFWSFRIMVGLGMLMILLAVYGCWQGFKGRLAESQRYLWLMQFTAPIGFIAIISGWITTEVGRQPWTVQGLLRTSDSASNIAASHLLTTFVGFVVVYAIMLFAFCWFFYYLVKKGPEPLEASEPVIDSAMAEKLT